MNLLETYKGRLKVAERMYSQQHQGEKLSEAKKLSTAKLLQNTSKFLNEAFGATTTTTAMASATQTGAANGFTAASGTTTLGQFKKFAMNLVNVVVPNLIANDIAIVYPMSSMSGYINYIDYSVGEPKSDYALNDTLMNPWQIGQVHNPSYTSQKVVDSFDSFSSGTSKLTWLPIAGNAVPGTTNLKDSIKLLDADGAVIEGATSIVVAADGTITVSGASGVKKIAYEYDNVVIPQDKLPMLKAEIKSLPLLAHARRIAVYYSQIAAFQAKTDYGFDLGDQLAEKAAGQLSYEIDTEVVGAIDEAAGVAQITWNKALPVGLSKAEHYEGFSEAVEIGKQIVYDATQRFAPNYMIIASNVLPILTFIKGFQAAPAGVINGPYFAGTLNGVKIFVSPALKAGRFLLGVNGDDMMSSAVVYAPYMPIVPTQLLGFADGGMTQGWCTLYDLKVLNANLVVAGEVIDDAGTAGQLVTLTRLGAEENTSA